MKTRLLFIFAATMLLFGCKKYIDLSAIKFEITNENFSVTGTTATMTADYSWPGKTISISMEVSEDEGFANAKSFEAAVSGNSLTVTATGLKAQTTYYYRLRLNTEGGRVESDKKTFKTTAYILPTVTTSVVNNIGATKAECGGNVASEGDLAVMSRGVCWSTTDNPTVDDSHTVDGSGAGAFSSSITGLTETTTYYVRAYATSSAGTSYGEVRTFTTTEYVLPTVSTSGVTNICGTKAECGGNVTYEGDFAVTARGVCWSTTNNPTLSDSHTADGSGAGAFSSSITGLAETTTYYVRAYATSSAGTSYGEVRTFTTTEYVLPTVSTSGVTNICGTKAECGGNVTYEGDFAVTARGVCWSTTNNPTLSDSHTADGSGAGAFSSSITGLTETTTYYLRAYATSSAGTSYGEVRTFTTKTILPTVSTSGVTNICGTKAECGGNVTYEGDFAVAARGVCWSTTDNPTVDDSHTVDGSGAGAFSSSITGLTENTTYYVRAYATSSAGTVYGEIRTFTTKTILPTVSTSGVTNICGTKAECGGNVTYEGDFAVTVRGVCWSTTNNPTLSDSHTADGSGAGTFSSSITGLTENTTYYVRAYATSSAGTSYGEEKTFTTTAYILPTVTTSEITSYSSTTAMCGGNVASEGDFPVTARGVCWSTTDNPTVDDSHTVDGSGAGAFSSSITGLTENTTYYVRAYATSSAGTSYGEEKTFTTTEYVLPTVSTSEVTNISFTTAMCGGNVASEGDFAVTARGVCWSTTNNPTLSDSHTADGSGPGAFSSSITGLTENTTYYVRAYATSSAGTSYGEERTFKTNIPNEFTVNGVTFEMVFVEGGTFDMGATSEQGGGADDEYPVHSVTLSDYCIGKYEVTQELWLAVMGSWPGTAPNSSCGVGANYPAYHISWNDCQEFVAELSRLTGRTFRLPTEAEWEYAARGGKNSLHYKYSGSNNIGDVAWYKDNSGNKTHPVGTKSANELGIYDMNGNVWEWCSDWYGSYSGGAQTNPQGPPTGSSRVLRGGSWNNLAGVCRVSNRYNRAPSIRHNGLGLRLALVL